MICTRSLRSTLRPITPILIVLASLALLVVWFWYREVLWLHFGFGREMGDLLPLYAAERPYSTSLLHGASGRLLLAIAAAVVCVSLVCVAVARRWPTWLCVFISLVSVFTVNVLIARIPQGHTSFTRPFAREGLEYFSDTRLVKNDPVGFIAKYPKLNVRSYYGLSHHAGTHPPGGVLFLWVGDKLFAPPSPPPKPRPNALQRFFGAEDEPPIETIRGLDVACWLAVSFTALAVIPAYVLASSIGGAAAARRLLPLYVAAPNLILFGATCMDGVFLTFTLSALAAGFVAMRRWSIVWPIIAGVLLWTATFMTFSAIAVPVLMGGYALCFGLRRPAEAMKMLARATIVGVVFIIMQLMAAHWLRYDIHATVEAAMRRDMSGMGIAGYESFAIWRNISLGNLLAFSIGSGLGITALFTVALFAERVPWRARAFSIAFPLCIFALACSTLFSMEVERVWLFLTPAALVVATRAFHGLTVWIVVIALALAQAISLEWFFNTWW